jgi:uncharacterized membrane protein
MAEDDETEGSAPQDRLGATEDNSLARLLTLTDGVFAIAMTLLALDLTLPTDIPKHPSDDVLRHALSLNSASYLSFIVSFYVIASYWMRHRRLMRSVVAVHADLIRDTLILLFVVAAMPFFTSVLGSYGSEPISLALYAGANLVAGATLMQLNRDVRRLGLTASDVVPDDYTHNWQSWYVMAVFALCIPGGYIVGGGHGPYLLILLAVPDRLRTLWRLIRKRTRAGRTRPG